MKSVITLFLAAVVVLLSGNFFGWWFVPVPGTESIPSYEQRKNQRETRLRSLRKASGMDEDGGSKISDEDAKRRSEALSTGGY